MEIIRPKFLILDSSHLAGLADDWSSNDESRSTGAKGFLNLVADKNNILLVSFEHLAETLRHGNENLVNRRIAFFQALPTISWVKCFSDGNVPGSVVDILSHEAKVAYEQPDATVHQVRNLAARSIFQFGSGTEFIKSILDSWDQLRFELQLQEKRERETVAISRSDFVDISQTKVTDWLNSRLRHPEDARRVLAMLEQRLARDIAERGDKRIQNADRTARQFLTEVEQHASHIIQYDSNPTPHCKFFYPSVLMQLTLQHMNIWATSATWPFSDASLRSQTEFSIFPGWD